MGEVHYKRRALRALAILPRDVAERFHRGFEQIACGRGQNLDISPLRGRDGYRLRIGKYRAIYQLTDGRVRVIVLDVGARGDIYR
ncbi:MAG: type II toxin-antitoxin system RelE/ParE family toxin [Gammaproteobacteria bacterium]|nr:MAG: type II toxin-antitoxin system RelE/ParE family toxin [Gammaproteobacteria bacterium]